MSIYPNWPSFPSRSLTRPHDYPVNPLASEPLESAGRFRQPMDKHSETRKARTTANVVNFDDALLDACPAEELAHILTEAALLAQAFAPDGQPEQLAAMAEALTAGVHEPDMDRNHARRLAAALRRRARGAET